MVRTFKTAVTVISLLGVASYASIITLTPPDADMGDLDHGYAYKWNLNLTKLIGSDKTINSATLKIDNVYNDNRDANVLKTWLLDISVPGQPNNPNYVYSWADDQKDDGNFFSTPKPYNGWTNSSLIGTFRDNDGPTTHNNLSWSIDVSKMNQWSGDNGWTAIGLDPDCHFYNDKISLVLDYSPKRVPEPSSISILLLGIGFLGAFAGFRKIRK